MNHNLTYSGLESIGEIPWGSHFCNLYNTQSDFLDSLVPYFKAGLENNESCLWITSEPFTAEDARNALGNVMPDFAQYEAREQIQIIDYRNWYLTNSGASNDDVLNNWIKRQGQALSQGYQGLRLSGNVSWLQTENWPAFMEYERMVNETFRHYRIVGLCSYCLDQCNSHHLLDVMHNHEFALVRRNSQWELIESGQLKAAKSELHKLNTELEQRVALRTQALEAALKTREDFLSMASHELKTPITTLQIYLQGVLRKHQQTDKMLHSELEDIMLKGLNQCKRLTKLVNNLLDISQPGKPLVLKKEFADLSLIIKSIVDSFSDVFKKTGCKVYFTAKESLVGYWDTTRIEQAITNLLDNVTKYAPAKPVKITVEQEDNMAIIKVADQGRGILSEQKPRIFERFAQLSENSYSSPGLGLGLWLVKQITHASGGDVNVESEAGKGATFIMTLPIEKEITARNLVV